MAGYRKKKPQKAGSTKKILNYHKTNYNNIDYFDNIDKIIKWGKRRPSDNSSSQVSNERKSINESKGNGSSD